MEETIKDVDIEQLLSGEQAIAPVASDEEGKQGQETVRKDVKTSPEAVSVRANARIRELVETVNKQNEFIAKNLEKRSTPNASEVDDFLGNIEDEPTKKLLADFANVVLSSTKREVSSRLSPAEKELQEIRFNREFEQLANKIPSLKAIENEVREKYAENPKGVKDIVGGILLDRQMAKVRPIEEGTSKAAREQIDIESATKEELYEALEQTR